jgi:hypothetical protein
MNSTREDTRSRTRASGVGADRVQQPTWDATEKTSGWTGWIAFAAVVMMLMGIFHAIQGLVAIFRDEYYLVSANGLVVALDYTAWGWIHLALGIVVLFAGFALIAGQLWARVVAVALAFFSTLVNIVFLAAYPLWSLAMIALDLVVIWAVTVHGDEMKPRRT